MTSLDGIAALKPNKAFGSRCLWQYEDQADHATQQDASVAPWPSNWLIEPIRVSNATNCETYTARPLRRQQHREPNLIGRSLWREGETTPTTCSAHYLLLVSLPGANRMFLFHTATAQWL